MKAYYDSKPTKFSAVGNGSVIYRYGIVEVESPTIDDEASRAQWECDEVTVWQPITRKKVVTAVISERWDSNYEQKLINDYNSVVLGVIEGDEAEAIKEAYISFLDERKALKAVVDSDCKENGIE